jgi:hypothetical protein
LNGCGRCCCAVDEDGAGVSMSMFGVSRARDEV